MRTGGRHDRSRHQPSGNRRAKPDPRSRDGNGRDGLYGLLFGPVIALSTAGEPPLDAAASQAAKYFANTEATWAQLAVATSTLGWIASLWFFVAFGHLLRRVEGIPPGAPPSRLSRARCWQPTPWLTSA
jgi:hypothetical protein